MQVLSLDDVISSCLDRAGFASQRDSLRAVMRGGWYKCLLNKLFIYCQAKLASSQLALRAIGDRLRLSLITIRTDTSMFPAG